MRSVLEAIRAHRRLQLQIVVTGMHLDPAHGRGARAIGQEGWRVDAVVRWPAGSGRTAATHARNTGGAIAGLATVFAKLDPDAVLVVGDRVEAFAAAAAGHLSQRLVAHVHGGDRARGQTDDSLRHAITKLSHLHFPATRKSAARVARLGEDRWRIHCVGTPGLDGIKGGLTPFRKKRGLTAFSVVVLHPVDADAAVEFGRAAMVARAVERAGFGRIVVIHPNNDPGSAGILRAWRERRSDARYLFHRDLPRDEFLSLLRNAAVLVGNSSAGIIEAASFGTPVVDIGPRQLGRQCSANVMHVPYDEARLLAVLRRIWNGGRPRRCNCPNVYGAGNAGARIARSLASVAMDDRLRRKLIAY